MQRSQIERLLPHVIRRAIQPKTPLDAIIQSMEQLLAPAVAVLDQIETYFNPYSAPDSFVPLLGSWVDLERVWESESLSSEGHSDAAKPGLGRFRELIAAAATLSRWRGTAAGLIQFLETATGARGVQIEDPIVAPNGAQVPFSFRVVVPGEFAGYENLIRRVIESEKPAYVTYELAFHRQGSAPLGPAPTREEV